MKKLPLIFILALILYSCQKELSCENCQPPAPGIPGRVFVQDKGNYIFAGGEIRPYLQIGFPGNYKKVWYIMFASVDSNSHADSVRFNSYQVGDEFIFD